MLLIILAQGLRKFDCFPKIGKFLIFYLTFLKVAPETKFVPYLSLVKNEEKLQKNLYTIF